MKLWSFTEDPLAVADYGPLETEDGARRFEIETARPAKDHLVARLKGIGDRNAAEKLRNTRLCSCRATACRRSRTPTRSITPTWSAWRRWTTDGAALGTVIAIHNFGAGDLIEIAPAAGGEPLLLPFTETDRADDRSEGADASSSCRRPRSRRSEED